MVNFQHGHPDKPFVMGGMFHGGTGLGGGVNNHMRSIQTKSGIKILMNDDEKSVNIIDPSGNNYLMDGQGNIIITAPNDITFNAGGNLAINVGQNMNTTVQMSSNESIGINKSSNVGMMNMLTVGKDFVTNVIGKLTHYVKGDMETYGEKEHKTISLKGMEVSSGNKIEHHAEKEINNNSNEKSKNH